MYNPNSDPGSGTYDEPGCKKGKRECVYPDEKTPSKGSASKITDSTIRESPGSSSDEDDAEGSEYQPLESIPDEDEITSSSSQQGNTPNTFSQRGSPGHFSSSRRSTGRQGSEVPSLIQDKGSSPTPSTEGSVGYAAYQTVGTSRLKQESFHPDALRSDWSHLPLDLQFYLEYFYENVTYLHYSLKLDPTNFLKTVMVDAALRNDALLHAIVGFAAFQRTLHNPEGKMQDFLQYYNKAVSLLLRSLKKGEQHSTGTLLAILQLATIEV